MTEREIIESIKSAYRDERTRRGGAYTSVADARAEVQRALQPRTPEMTSTITRAENRAFIELRAAGELGV